MFIFHWQLTTTTRNKTKKSRKKNNILVSPEFNVKDDLLAVILLTKSFICQCLLSSAKKNLLNNLTDIKIHTIRVFSWKYSNFVRCRTHRDKYYVCVHTEYYKLLRVWVRYMEKQRTLVRWRLYKPAVNAQLNWIYTAEQCYCAICLWTTAVLRTIRLPYNMYARNRRRYALHMQCNDVDPRPTI